MDPVTHGLTGALLAEAGLRQRYGRQATAALVGGALLPDIDILWSTGQGVLALETHRGITHSLLGGLGLALLLAAAVRPLGPVKRWGPLAGMAILGLGFGHLFLDLITPYGIQLFLPFSRARPAWDWLFIVDPWLTGPVLLALVVAWWRRAVLPARLGCAWMVAYLAFMGVSHGVAVSTLRAQAGAAGLEPRAVAALPRPLRPLERLGVEVTDDGYARGPVRVLAPGPLRLERLPRGPETDLVRRVEALPPVRTYLWFARFPVVALLEEDGRRVLEFRDLRFSDRLRRRDPFVLRVVVDPSGAVQQVIFR